MKMFLFFGGKESNPETGDPLGGWEHFVCESDSPGNLEPDAYLGEIYTTIYGMKRRKVLFDMKPGDAFEWWHIVDSTTGKIVQQMGPLTVRAE